MKRDEATEEDVLVRQAGDEHEREYLAGLKATADVVEIDRRDEFAFSATARAMREGRPVIYQARLELGEFAGWSDFLFRVDGPSELGAWHYEVWDTKLARSMKPYFAIQLCCYAEMLEEIQGYRPDQAGIILGNGEREGLRLSDYWFYYRAIKRAFLEQQRSFDPKSPPPFPGLADYRHWTGCVTRQLKARNDVSLVANIRTVQIEKLSAADVATLPELAESKLETVPKMAAATFDRLRSQARLQFRSRSGAPPLYELLPVNPEAPRQGFAALPPASPNDVAFDIEGYPLTDGGLEYLLGVTVQENSRLVFRDWWAHNAVEEQQSFEQFVDWVYARWRQDPTLHIYHYAAYETTALKRLMCRYATREHEIDELLRNQVFVDLYTVVRQSLLIGEPAYSLKNVEHLYLPPREGEVATAGQSMVYYHRWLTARDGQSWRDSATLKLIRDYNQADCESTWHLIPWLRQRQTDAGRPYIVPEPPRELAEDTSARAVLAREMTASIPQDRAADPERWRVHELLAYLLEFHRREKKSLYWARYERMDMTGQELLEDRECLAGVERIGRLPTAVKQSYLYEYRFPLQESKMRDGSRCLLASDGKTGLTIETIDYDAQLLTIKRGKRNGPPPERFNLIPDEIVGTDAIADRSSGRCAGTSQPASCRKRFASSSIASRHGSPGIQGDRSSAKGRTC